MKDIERMIRSYLARSAGTCNHPTDHTLRCFLGMIETGEATQDDFQRIGGEFLVNDIQRVADELNTPMKEQSK